MSLKICEISDTYINYLKKYFHSTMMDNKEGNRIHSRKYIGVVFEINGFLYFAPMSSPKPSDYQEDGITIRNSSRIILRMVKSITTNPILLGTIKLNNMIPVPISEIVKYDYDHEIDSTYKDLVHDELIWIQRNTTRIQSEAKKLYNIKNNEAKHISNANRKFYQSIMPFKEAEAKCLLFNSQRVLDL